MKTGIKIGNWGKVLFASLFAMVALGAQAIDKSLQAILDVRDPKGEPVRPGYWHADLAACRAKAEKEKIPMLAVWSNDGCFHCQIFEKAVNSDAFKEWQKTSGYIYCFICSVDADSPQGSANYTWCKGPGAKLKDWPLCRLYWPAGGVDYAVRGDVIDKQQGEHFVGDISDKQVLERFAEEVIGKYGHVDFLVNNALPMMKGVDACSYEEGMQTMRQLGLNMAFLIKSIRLGLEQFGSPKIQEELTETHFIR